MILTFSTSASSTARDIPAGLGELFLPATCAGTDVTSTSDSSSLVVINLFRRLVIGQASVTRIRQQRTVFIADLGRPDLALRDAVPVIVEADDAGAVAYSIDLDEMGMGETESDALEDLRGSIAESYLLLKHEPNLGPLQQRHLRYLKQIIREH